MILDGSGALRNCSNSGRPSTALARLAMKFWRTWVSALCSDGVGQRSGRIRLELARRYRDHRRRSPIGPGFVMPASTSATWRDAILAAVALQLARHVHQAAEIARQQNFGLRRLDVLRLLGDNGVRQIGVFDRERAAEAAAGFAILHLDQFEALDGGKQSTRLVTSLRVRAGPSRNRDRSPWH